MSLAVDDRECLVYFNFLYSTLKLPPAKFKMKITTKLITALICIISAPTSAKVEINWSAIGGAPNATPYPQSSGVYQPASYQASPAKAVVATSAATEDTEKVPTPDTLWGAKWSGLANAGAVFQSGNSETESLQFDVKSTAKWDKHRIAAKAEYQREEDNDIKTEDNKKLELEGDYFYKPKWFANMNAEFEQDEIAELDMRSTIGLGVGHQLYDEDDLKLKYIIGPNYLSEETTDGQTESSLAYNWRFDYEQKFWDGFITLFHNHRFLVPADETSAYIIDTNTGLRVPLQKKLVATLEIEHDIDKGAPVGTSETDTQYGFKLGYEW